MLQSSKGFSNSRNMTSTVNNKGTALKEQLAFSLYACAKEMTRKMKFMLRDCGLTYTQYIAMLVLWEKGSINVKALGEQLYLDSGTLTPMLKKMEIAGFIKRKRDRIDERNLIVSITEKGMQLKEETVAISAKMTRDLPLGRMEINQLSSILDKLLTGLTAEE